MIHPHPRLASSPGESDARWRAARRLARSASLSAVEAPSRREAAPGSQPPSSAIGSWTPLATRRRLTMARAEANDGQPYIAHLLRVCRAGDPGRRLGGRGDRRPAPRRGRGPGRPGAARATSAPAIGHTVADIVDECTDSYGDPKPPWRRRKEDYIRSLDRASAGGLLVSLADKLDNMTTLVRGFRIRGEDQWTRTGRSAEDMLWFYGTLAGRYSELRPGPLSGELARAVVELKRLIEGTGQGAGADGRAPVRGDPGHPGRGRDARACRSGAGPRRVRQGIGGPRRPLLPEGR